MNPEITVTEDRQIVCSVCKYEPSSQGIAPAWEIIEDVGKHYYDEHDQNRNCGCPNECPDHTQLRDNKR